MNLYKQVIEATFLDGLSNAEESSGGPRLRKVSTNLDEGIPRFSVVAM